MAMPITGEPALALCGAAEASAAESEADCSAAKPLHRLPVALLAVGEAPAAVEPASSSLALAAGFVATEPAKTGCPLPVVVMPCVAPLRRAPNCSAAEVEPLALPEPVVGSLPALLLVPPWDGAVLAGALAESAGASVESAGSGARAGVPVKAGLVDSAAGVGAGAGVSAGSGARAGAAAGAGAGVGAGTAGAGAAGIGAGASGAAAGAWAVAGGTAWAGGGAGDEGVPNPGPVQAQAKLAPTTPTAKAESTATGKTLRTIGNPAS